MLIDRKMAIGYDNFRNSNSISHEKHPSCSGSEGTRSKGKPYGKVPKPAHEILFIRSTRQIVLGEGMRKVSIRKVAKRSCDAITTTHQHFCGRTACCVKHSTQWWRNPDRGAGENECRGVAARRYPAGLPRVCQSFGGIAHMFRVVRCLPRGKNQAEKNFDSL